jgi:hypothetical protein
MLPFNFLSIVLTVLVSIRTLLNVFLLLNALQCEDVLTVQPFVTFRVLL